MLLDVTILLWMIDVKNDVVNFENQNVSHQLITSLGNTNFQVTLSSGKQIAKVIEVVQ